MRATPPGRPGEGFGEEREVDEERLRAVEKEIEEGILLAAKPESEREDFDPEYWLRVAGGHGLNLAAEVRRLQGILHEREMHPDYEYAETTGPRKAWYDADKPPKGEGWEPNVHQGRDGWERFDYHEEAYWMRRKGSGEVSGKE